MLAPLASAFQTFRRPALLAASLGIFLGLAAVTPPALAAGGTVTANLLDGYQKPLTIVVDLMDDSADSQTIAANIRHGLGILGIPAVEDGEVVLEVNVSASADVAGQGRSSRAEAESRAAVTQSDSLTTMAPTRELSPNPAMKNRRAGQGSANLDVTMTLYKRGHPPMWRASGSAPRDFRSVADQASDLAGRALSLLGRTGTISLD